MSDLSGDIRTTIKGLPEKPGIYQYLNREGEIIYVGKAKNLKKRVASYFNRDQHLSKKTLSLVRSIADIRIIIADNELDALLLENTLIKKHQPRYNVMLKDDKSYPCIVIKKENFPRVLETRQIVKDGSEYFGPFVSGKMMYAMMDLVKHLFKLRNCNLNLGPRQIAKQKYKVCLEYHIGNCRGPCQQFQSEEQYMADIEQIRKMLRGDLYGLMKEMKAKMHQLAAEMRYEEAHELKIKTGLLEKYRSKSVVVSTTIHHVDVFTILTDDEYAFVNYLKVANGSIVLGHTLEIKKKLDEDERDLLLMGITELRSRFSSTNKEIIVPFNPAVHFGDIQFVVPQRGDKKKLLDMSLRNAEYFKREKQKQYDLIDPERHTRRILNQMKTDLRLSREPVLIECFDNSNIQGEYAVAAMTVFRNTRPSKKEYRHFNVKTVTGPDDFATMEEIIYRRYKRVLDEKLDLPDLVIIDGGKGQLGAAVKSIEKLGLRGRVAILGIAKKLEELYFPDDPLPLYLDKKSETLKIIQQIRDEAHRFGITHHRSKRSKAVIKSSLTEIKGIGEKTVMKLLQHFGSAEKVGKAELTELEKVVGKSAAQKVFRHYAPLTE